MFKVLKFALVGYVVVRGVEMAKNAVKSFLAAREVSSMVETDF